MGASPHSFIVMRESLKSTGGNDESNFFPTSRPTLRNNKRRQYLLSPSTKMRRSSGVHHVKRSVRGLGLRIERKVRTLKRLIPNCNRSTGTEGLFQDTADYILSLQARVRVMQMMVDLLEGSS